MKKRSALAVIVASLFVGVVAAQVLGGALLDTKSGTVALAPVNATLSSTASEQLSAMGPGMTVVECAPGIVQLKPGFHSSREPSFMMTHPSFVVLADGHCAYDTSSTPAKLVPANVDSP